VGRPPRYAQIATLASLVREKPRRRRSGRWLREFSKSPAPRHAPPMRPDRHLWNGALRKYNGSLTGKDLGFDSLYNTYEHGGLPPGPLEIRAKPLCVPRCGLRSRTIFYLWLTPGGHFFSATLAEHNRNVVRYRRLLVHLLRSSARLLLLLLEWQRTRRSSGSSEEADGTSPHFCCVRLVWR